jgi:isoleucyl-tRNA synthetase
LSSISYKETLSLPKTDFPMKASLINKEPELLKFWEKEEIYKKLLKKRADSPKFTLHDGPPYANGDIHLGHCLNKILKDLVIKSKSMAGFLSEYVPGWDCHGQPIEHKVVDVGLKKQKNSMSVMELRKACREYALKYVDIQREQFKRIGVFGLWNTPYLTLDPKYEAAVLRKLGDFAGNNLLYKRKKPVHWCVSCITALAEAEVEYEDVTSPSIYVKFPLLKDQLKNLPKLKDKKVSVLIWTTTPWTIPANLAITLHPEFDYIAVEVSSVIPSEQSDNVIPSE